MTTNWIIEKMNCKILENNLANVVYQVHWRYIKSDVINNQTYYVNNIGIVNIPSADPLSFTPYESLTKTQVLNWVQTELGQQFITDMDDRLTAEIINLSSRTLLDPPFTN